MAQLRSINSPSIPFDQVIIETRVVHEKSIHLFPVDGTNIDAETVASFGDEWTKFGHFTDEEIRIVGDQYFDIVPNEYVRDKTVLDVGCGSGRWSRYVANTAKSVDSVDPSDAVYSAAKLLREYSNVRISRASVDNLPFADDTFDLVFSLGVLHHIPDTAQAMHDCVRKVRPGGYFLVYLYYNLDNRGLAFKLLFLLSNIGRRVISRLPATLKKAICDVIAFGVYLPFVAGAKMLRSMGLHRAAKAVPLSYYADKSLHVIKNDALDRFGTPLEQRFSKDEIRQMMERAGLRDIVFSDHEPYWHAIGRKR